MTQRCILICSGGAQVFLVNGHARFSTTDHTMAMHPSNRRMLRDLQGGAPVEIGIAFSLLRRKTRIAFADGTVWTLTPTQAHHWRADIDDGSISATLSLDQKQRIAVHADGRTLATGTPRTAQIVSDQQWTLDADDDVDACWLASVVSAMLLSL